MMASIRGTKKSHIVCRDTLSRCVTRVDRAAPLWLSAVSERDDTGGGACAY